MQSIIDSLGLHLDFDGTSFKCTRARDDLPLPHTSIPPPLTSPTPYPTSSTSFGSTHILHSPINSMNLRGSPTAPCAIPIYAIDLRSAEAVGALMNSSDIKTALKQYGGIQLRQTPPIPGWGGPEETLNRVRESSCYFPSFGPNGQ